MFVLALSQSEALEYLGWGGIGILALVILAVLVLVGGAAGISMLVIVRFIREMLLLPADRALAPLGRTVAGKSIYSLLMQLVPLVDQSTDSLPSQLAKHSNYTAEQWVGFLSTFTRGLADLFDGIAAGDSGGEPASDPLEGKLEG